jgi:hypothetical protein
MRDAKTDARTHWTRVLERMAGKAEPDDLSRTILDSFNEIGLDELQSVELDDGRTFFVPRELAAKLSTRERKPLPEPEVIDVSLEIEEDAAALEPDEATPLVTASEDASVSELARDDLFDLIREEVAPVYQEIRKEWRELLYQIVGKV